MKPFDLDLAKAGHPVCTRDGRSARIICFDRKGSKPIVALILEDNKEYEYQRFYYSDGKFLLPGILPGTESKDDLVMASTKKEGWINIYPPICSPKLGGIYTASASCVYETREQALFNSEDECIDTIRIEWEEF